MRKDSHELMIVWGEGSGEFVKEKMGESSGLDPLSILQVAWES